MFWNFFVAFINEKYIHSTAAFWPLSIVQVNTDYPFYAHNNNIEEKKKCEEREGEKKGMSDGTCQGEK